MKPKSLYVKILLSFLGILFLTELFILALFVATAGRSFRSRMDKETIGKLIVFKQIVQEKINHAPLAPLEKKQEIKDFLTAFSQLFDINIWVTDVNAQIVFKTVSTLPDLSLNRGPDVTAQGIRFYQLSRRHLSYYADIRLDHNGETLHLYLNKEREKKPEAVFFLGLLAIGCIIALLIIPLTRIITRRIRQLNDTALEFANGNLKKRARIKGHDEIAGLGKTFDFMADKLDHMIQSNKVLIANISHELRSPLARIRVSKELIAERLDDEPAKEIDRYMQHMDQDIDRVDKLIDQILKLSKMDFQESIETPGKIAFIPFFADIEKQYAPLFQHKNIVLEKKFEPDLMLHADLKMLETVFSNLLDNAVKFTEPDEQILVTARRENKTGMVFTISNPCRKLTPDELHHLFEPFYRLDKNKTIGSGLGLTIVKKLLKKNNADIQAKNTDTGLLFELEFKGTS
jgi:two-component system sensor histidine kinase CpxA